MNGQWATGHHVSDIHAVSRWRTLWKCHPAQPIQRLPRQRSVPSATHTSQHHLHHQLLFSLCCMHLCDFVIIFLHLKYKAPIKYQLMVNLHFSPSAATTSSIASNQDSSNSIPGRAMTRRRLLQWYILLSSSKCQTSTASNNVQSSQPLVIHKPDEIKIPSECLKLMDKID